jgi:hypothetical protein
MSICFAGLVWHSPSQAGLGSGPLPITSICFQEDAESFFSLACSAIEDCCTLFLLWRLQAKSDRPLSPSIEYQPLLFQIILATDAL